MDVFNSSNWLEREIWDLFGIYFQGHSDLRRILTDYGFKSHPLRKDFPLSGFDEVFFNVSSRRIVYAPVVLAQAYRSFSFSSLWISSFFDFDSDSEFDEHAFALQFFFPAFYSRSYTDYFDFILIYEFDDTVFVPFSLDSFCCSSPLDSTVINPVIHLNFS